MSKEMRRLLEAVEELNEAFVEYRDPEGRFQVIYEPPRGYWAIGKNDYAQDISGESFDHIDDAIEHAEICLGIADDDLDEDFATEPDRYMPWSGMGGHDDPFGDENPATDMHIKAINDVPSLYMKAGDTMYIRPTENQGEVYSEENGLEYDWDWISELIMRGDVDITGDGYPGETEPYIEEDLFDSEFSDYSDWALLSGIEDIESRLNSRHPCSSCIGKTDHGGCTDSCIKRDKRELVNLNKEAARRGLDSVDASSMFEAEEELGEGRFENEVAEEKRRSISSLAHILAAEVFSVIRSRSNVDEETREGMTNYILEQTMKDLRSRVNNILDDESQD